MALEFTPAAALFLGDTPLAWQPLGFNDPWMPEEISEELLGSTLSGDAAGAELTDFSVRLGRVPAGAQEGGVPEGFEVLDAPEMVALGSAISDALRRKLAKIRARLST